jgi:hypothetical protein
LEYQKVATATQRRGWNIDSLTTDQKSDLEKGRLIRARQRAIGRELRRMYDNVAKEPVPDDFLDLLHKIDEMGTERGKKGS